MDLGALRMRIAVLLVLDVHPNTSINNLGFWVGGLGKKLQRSLAYLYIDSIVCRAEFGELG